MLSYIYAYSQLKTDTIQFVVPSGNMGNVTAGLFASQMGFPFSSFIIATNENDVAVNYYKTGSFVPQQTIQTLSNAMDIGNPSNFIRILDLFKHTHSEFKKRVRATKISETETVATIKRVYKEHQYLLDPHTAVAWAAAEQNIDVNHTSVVVATASPLKFSSEIYQATGISVDDSVCKGDSFGKKKKKYPVGSSYKEFKTFLNGLSE